MASRLRIILLSALPAGVSIFYLLWKYAWKKKTSGDAEVPSKPVESVPSIEVTAATDDIDADIEIVNDRLETDFETLFDLDLSKVNCNRSQPESFSLSDEIDVSSLSREPSSSNADAVLVLEDLHGGHSSGRVSPITSVESTAAVYAVLRDESDDTCLNVNNATFIIQPASTIADEIRNTINEADLCNDSFVKDNVKLCGLDIDDASDNVFEVPVKAVNCLVQEAVKGLSNTDNDEGGVDCWGNALPDNIDSCDVVSKDGASLIIVRKESIDSASDGASRNSSKDRNGNSCKRNNKKNKVASRKQSQSQPQSKEKQALKSHSFDFPTEFCGQLIGKKGHHVGLMKEKTGVEIYIRAKLYDKAWQIVTLEGTQQQVNKALDMVRRRFPSKFYPGIDLSHSLPDLPVVPAELMQLTLPTGVSLEVVVCSVVTANHLFVHQPTHPTFPTLERQTMDMRACYNVEDVPSLPRPIEVGVICAAPMGSNWYRAQIVASYQDIDEYEVKLVDIGGYHHVSGTVLRQIRSDFMAFPFQAIECYLANIVPLRDDEEFLPEAKTLLEDLVRGSILQCTVVAVESDGVPYIELTKLTDKGKQAIIINREIVHRELARWYEM